MTSNSTSSNGRSRWVAADRLLAPIQAFLASLAARRFGLSAKLLGLTVLFVMLAEVFIFVPSIANFRAAWLSDRLSKAYLAALAGEAFPGGDVPQALEEEILRKADIRMVALKRNEQRRLVLSMEQNIVVDAVYDLRAVTGSDGAVSRLEAANAHWRLLVDAVAVFFSSGERYIRVLGQPEMGPGEFVEIVLQQRSLKAAMLRHALNILLLSIVISAIVGGLVYVALNALFVQPLQRLTRNMEAFSVNPEDAARIIVPSTRVDEIGTAERELAHMQGELNQMLAQKSRLAALGLAVSKINHDMRNMLANAQLLSDNLTSVPDPRVQRFAPKLIASLDRAIKFCNDTLRYGRAAEAPPRRTLQPLRPLVDEVGDGLGLPRQGKVDWRIDVEPDLLVDADRDQLYRVLANLIRNAAQAIETLPDGEHGGITVSAVRAAANVTIDVVDSGPGLQPLAQAHLFQPFQGSTRRGGSGLGLAIAHELVAAHGGTLVLREKPATALTARGTHFQLAIPDRATDS